MSEHLFCDRSGDDRGNREPEQQPVCACIIEGGRKAQGNAHRYGHCEDQEQRVWKMCKCGEQTVAYQTERRVYESGLQREDIGGYESEQDKCDKVNNKRRQIEQMPGDIRSEEKHEQDAGQKDDPYDERIFEITLP